MVGRGVASPGWTSQQPLWPPEAGPPPFGGRGVSRQEMSAEEDTSTGMGDTSNMIKQVIGQLTLFYTPNLLYHTI